MTNNRASPQKIGSQSTHYIHNPRGIASQQVGSVWSDAVSDGLGSVRGWLNSSQVFTDTNMFDPYGVPDSAVSGFGFTGEMTDANGLVHLRARYYDPNVGVFASLDPFEGVHNRPMSMNGYSWVEGNVANWSDASGLFSEYDVSQGTAQYSCYCGWLDWSHIGNGNPMFDLLNNMERATNYSGHNPYPFLNPLMNTRLWGFSEVGYIAQDVPILSDIINEPLQIPLFSGVAIVPEKEILTLEGKVQIALSILMSKDYQFEQAQGSAPIGRLRPSLWASSFSEEDLVSNLIGMYIGFHRFHYNTSETTSVKTFIRRECGSFNTEASLDVFRCTYNNGQNLASWRMWYPRYLHLLECTNNPNESIEAVKLKCNQMDRAMPTFLTNLASQKLPQEFMGKWWWHDFHNNSYLTYRIVIGGEINENLRQVFIEPT